MTPGAIKRLVFWSMSALLVAALVIATLNAGRMYSWLVPVNQRADDLAWDDPAEDLHAEMRAELPTASDRRTLTPQGAGLGWPTLHGPTHDNCSPETGLDLDWSDAGPPEKWRIPVGTGYAGPVAIDDCLVLAHRKQDRECVECFDCETGRSKWETSWPATYECPFNHSSGPYSTPVIDGGHVYALGADGEMRCLRLADGESIWRRNLHRDYQVKIEVWPAATSPLVEGNRLIINIGGRTTQAGIVALDKNTGQTLWTATSDGASCATARAATIADRRYLFVWTADALVSLAPDSGLVYWRIPFAASNYEAAHGTSPLVAGDVVLVSGYQIGNLCVRVLPDGSHRELWRDRRQSLDSQYNNLVHLAGHVCGFSTTRRDLRCLDLFTGELKWKWRSPVLNGTTIAVDGGYILFGEKGRLAALDIGTAGVQVRSLTRRPVLAAPAMSYPALHNGLLYLRNEQEMVCIDLRKEDVAPGGSFRGCAPVVLR